MDLDKHTVKTHILRTHAKLWRWCNPTIDMAQKLFHAKLIRDHPSPYCCKPVYGVTHATQCPVIARTTRDLQPDKAKGLTTQMAWDLLRDPELAQHNEVVEALTQACYLGGEQITDFQTWKRHMQQKRTELWKQLLPQLESRLQPVMLNRPFKPWFRA